MYPMDFALPRLCGSHCCVKREYHPTALQNQGQKTLSDWHTCMKQERWPIRACKRREKLRFSITQKQCNESVRAMLLTGRPRTSCESQY